jgi:tetratricopeptide (TPR) repeat protein
LCSGGLGTADVARLVATTVGTRPDERLVRAVHERTEGNPFFVTELLPLLQSEGTLQGDDAMTAARRAIPVGVREVLQRRLARLPEQTNAVLLVGAVAGRGFDLDLVEAVAGLDEERALEAVEAAVVAGLVVEDEEAVGRYQFAHGLVRETIYEDISRARRVRLHARVGEALLGLHGRDDPEHVLELARHWWAAVSVTGAEAALPFVLAAADHAMAKLAFEQAEQQLHRALEVLESMPPTEAADDPAALPALVGVHSGYTVRAEHDRARALAERVLHGVRRSEDPQALLAGHFLLGHTLSVQGELSAARHHLEAAVRLAAAMPEATRLPGIPLALGAAGLLEIVLVVLGLHDQATRVAEAASRAIERSPHPYAKAAAMVTGEYAAVNSRDPRLLRERAAAAAALCERWGFQMLAVSATAPLGWAQAIEGDPAGGARLLRQALARWAATGSQAARPQLLGLLAEAEQLAGRPDEALRLLDEALTQVNRTGERFFEAELHRLKGESLLAMSPLQADEAETAFATSIAVARRQGAKLLEDRATTSLDRLRAARRPQSSR